MFQRKVDGIVEDADQYRVALEKYRHRVRHFPRDVFQRLFPDTERERERERALLPCIQ